MHINQLTEIVKSLIESWTNDQFDDRGMDEMLLDDLLDFVPFHGNPDMETLRTYVTMGICDCKVDENGIDVPEERCIADWIAKIDNFEVEYDA